MLIVAECVMSQKMDVLPEQVKRGMAWAYTRYVKDHDLHVLQHEAKGAKRGLWAEASPMPPWEFRKQGKKHVRQI